MFIRKTNQAALRQSRLLVALLCLILCAAHAAQAQTGKSNLTQPFTLSDDFQGDSLGQWASYPPAQDIGYEPSLSPTRGWDAPGGRALMRILQPTRAGSLRFGFIKNLGMVTSEGAHLSFAYRLNAQPISGDSIEIGLAGADGRRYLARIPSRANLWTTIELSLKDLHDATGRAPAPGTGIDALYLLSDLKHADPDVTYRFLIDNVTLSAEREAQFEVRVPQAVSIFPWRQLVSKVVYRSGDAIRIEAAAPIKLSRAEGSLLMPDGRSLGAAELYDDGTHGDARAGDNVWSTNSLYTLRPTDASGLWMINLRGMTTEGRSIETPVRFILHSADVASHPRLLFGGSDRETLLARTRQAQMAALWAKFLERAKASREGSSLDYGGEVFKRLDREYLLPSLLGYFGILSQARERISTNAFVAYLTDDAEALSAAKSAMLDVAGWSSWAPPWFGEHGQHTYYPAGELSIDVALAYDLLYDRLTTTERARIRRALIERSIIPTYKEYVLDNRAMANTSNWISHTVCGALFAAAAIAGDDAASDRNDQLETYINGLLLKLEDHLRASYLPDGSYGEGISYQEFDLESLAPTMVALRRVFDIDYSHTFFVKDSLAFPLYTMTRPIAASLDMGDSHPPSGRTIAPLVSESKDPLLQWYYRQFDHSSIIDFIFFDDTVAPRPPALPTSRLFAEKGNAVFRTGWGADDAVLLYRAGPTFNHNHNDQGSFLLSAFGENLISEAGWSDYYKDPYYATYFTQAIGHNTVLVDGNPESQSIADTRQFAALDAYPRMIEVVTSDFYDALSSELSSVYGGRLERFTRRIVFVKPYYIVVSDELTAKGTPAQFDWLLHLPDRSRIKTAPNAALYAGDSAALAVRLLTPGGADLQVHDGHIPYPIFATGTPKTLPPQPAFLDWRTPSPAGAAQFLVALVPAKTAKGAQTLAGGMSAVADEKWTGLRAVRGAERDLVLFRRSGAGGEASFEQWTTDAEAVTMTQTSGGLKMLALQGARRFKEGGRTLLTSEQPLSLAVRYDAEAVEISVNGASPTELKLFVGASPRSIRLDDRDLTPVRYERAEGMLSINLPAGRHRVLIARRAGQ